MAVNFYLDNRVDQRGDAPIRLSVVIRGVRYLTSVGYKIAPTKWDAQKQQCRKGSSNASGQMWSAINTALAKIREHFVAYEAEQLANNAAVTVNQLREEFFDTFGREKKSAADSFPRDKSFWGCYELFVRERGRENSWTKYTYQKFAALKNHLKDFEKKQTAGLSFGFFNSRGLHAFVTFLRDSVGMKNSTADHRYKVLKTFLRWSADQGYNTETAFRTYSPKLKTAPRHVVFLDWDELMRVFRYDVPANGTTVTLTDSAGKEYVKVVHDASALKKTRDIFLFCCFTSLRFSDAENLRLANISGKSMTLTTVKTADTITIELNKYALAILERYADIDLGGYALPRITNQRMNGYLKDLAELCGLNWKRRARLTPSGTQD